MTLGLIGQKIGMTTIFDNEGLAVPVTVVKLGANIVTHKLTKQTHGYTAIQVGGFPVKERKLTKPQLGSFKKHELQPLKPVREFRVDDSDSFKVGESLKVDSIVKEGELVDIRGRSIGKGFQGGMKRWHWDGGPKTHGSTSHRRVGSIGSSTTPGRVWKGHHMPGHMGNIRVTVSGLKVIKVDSENNLLAVKGAVPGYSNNYVMIRMTTKQKRQVIKPIIAEQKAESLKKDAKKQASAKK